MKMHKSTQCISTITLMWKVYGWFCACNMFIALLYRLCIAFNFNLLFDYICATYMCPTLLLPFRISVISYFLTFACP